MVVAFTGTSTGKVYVAGQKYSNGNGTYTAQADGTFKNDKTGRSTVGSSQSDKVSFFNIGGGGGVSSGSKSTGSAGSAKGAGAGSSVVVVAGGKGAPGVGPGVPAVVKPGGSGALLGGGFLSTMSKASGIQPAWTKGVVLPANDSKVTQLFVNGVAVPRNPGTSDVQDVNAVYGEGDDPWSPGFLPSWGVALENYNYAASQTWAWQQVEGFRASNMAANARAAAEAKQRVEDFDADWQKRRDGFDLSGSGL